MVEIKTCSKCKDDLSVDRFNARSSCCKPCQATAYRNWRKNNLDKERERRRSYRNANKTKIQKQQREYFKQWISRLKSRFIEWRKSAYQRNIQFDLTLEELESMPLTCYYTGTFLTLESNKRNTISLDRLDSSKGYTKNNVVYCCGFINLMKHELSYEQFIEACRSVLDHTQLKISASN